MSDLDDSKKDELLDLMEELQSENEQLKEKSKELLRQKSEDSSTISMLKNKVREQSQEIVRLDGVIARLHGSDLQLKEAERLRQETEKRISNAKAGIEAEWADIGLAHENLCAREKAVDRMDARLKNEKADFDGTVKRKTEEIAHTFERDYDARKRVLDDRYRKMTAGYKTRHYMALGYGYLITVLLGVTSATVRHEFAFFFGCVFEGIKVIFTILLGLGGLVARLGDLIPQVTVATVVHWILQVAVPCGVTAVAGYFGYKGATCIKKFFKRYYADEVTVSAVLCIVAVAVVFADWLTAIPVSLILLCILTFIAYMVIRGLVRWDDADAKKGLIIWTVGITVIIVLICCAGSMAESLHL